MTETQLLEHTDLYDEVDCTLTGEKCTNCLGLIEFVVYQNLRSRVCNERCPECGSETNCEPYFDDDD